MPVIESKFVRKLIRRVQFASIVAANPWQGGAMYKLIKQPGAVDSISLGGLAGSPLIERLKSSPLISTGNALVPVRVAENLYLKGCWDDALALLRKTPGRDAQMKDGWLSLFRGDVDRAMSIFSAAMDRQATKIQACRNLALCHYIQGDLDRAVETVRIGAAMSPKTSSLMTLFSRLVRDTHDIDRFLDEKMRIARNGFTIGTAAQFIRACGRAGATEAGERTARDAVVNFCQKHPADAPLNGVEYHVETGLRTGAYSRGKGEMVLNHIAEVAQGSGVRFFAMGGTLLGLIREGELISWDKDMDFGCFAEEASFEDLWRIFTANPYFLPMGTAEDRLIKLQHLTGITVDIFVNFSDGEGRWHGGQFVRWRDRPFDLRRMAVGGRELYVPDDPEAYLEGHYGENWRSPDPHFDVFWEAPNAFGPNEQHRYLNTIAKGLQFLSTGALDKMSIRLERARYAGAADVVAGYTLVLDLYRTFAQ